MKRLLLIGLFNIYTYALWGQNTIGLPQIINYNKADFRAGTQTWDIKQDSRGIMYFANNDGLVTFDGSYWKLYPIPNKTILRSLAIDQQDRVFVGAQNELGYYSPGPNGVLVYTSLKSLLPKPQNEFADIWDIEIFGESVFFRATDRIFEWRNNSIQVYPSSSEWRFLKKTGSRLYAQDKTIGLMEFRNNGWYPLGTRRVFTGQLVSGMLPYKNDSIIVTTLKDGIYILSGDTVIPHHTDVDAELRNSQLYVTAMMNDREFVAGTTSAGCFIMNLEGRLVQKISHTESLQNNNVLCVYLDKDKNLWTGLNNGISFIAYNSAIKYIRPNKTNELSGYSSRIIQNNLYIATSDGTHVVPLAGNNSDFSFSKGDFTQIKNSTGQVWRLDEVNQQLLMGYNDGAFVIRNNEAVPLSQGTGAWLFVPTSRVFPSKEVLVGTYSGLRMMHFDEQGFTDKGKIEGVSESFRFLAIDNSGNTWSSHPYRGVYRFELSPGGKSYQTTLYTDKDGLPVSLGNYVYRIKSRVVFATEKGVYEFDETKKRFIKSPFLGNVFGDMEIRYLNEDADGNIWFCSGKKLGVVNFSKPANGQPYTITYFPEMTGQILTGFENIYPYNKENIFIGSEKGIIHLDYAKYVLNKQKLSILLGQVKAIGKTDSLIFGGYATKNANKPKRLSNSYNSFHFEYSSPSYGLQNNLEYSYQLVGYDEKWSAWSSRTEKDYTNLPDGKYTFQVKVHDNLGNESLPITYVFVVQPAWYNTIWAYILYMALFFMGAYGVVRWQRKKLRLQQQKFDEEQKQMIYIHQLELEKNEKEIIKLQNESLANEVKFKNKELADASMHLVERSDAMSKVKDELQKLYRNTGNNHDVKKAIQLLNEVEKNNSNWEQFASHFDEVNNDFLKKIKSKFPNLSNTDLKVCAYLQLNLSSKEIAQLMNISVRGVEISRYRLRKKLQIPTEQTLNDFLNGIS